MQTLTPRGRAGSLERTISRAMDGGGIAVDTENGRQRGSLLPSPAELT